jgi:hypothetical protein
MSYNNVRNYTDKQLLDKVKSLDSFVKIPRGMWILGVRSNEDAADINDDKFYVFKGEKFIMVLRGSTNPGKYALLNWRRWSKKGAAVIKANEWYYSVWKKGLHKGKMEALKQVGEFKVIRDNNNNMKSGDGNTWTWERNRGLNFHTVSYKKGVNVVRKLIGLWSAGCQIVNNVTNYYKFLRLTGDQQRFTYCLLDEFEPIK